MRGVSPPPMHTFEGSRVVGCYFATLSAFHRAIELLLIRGLEHFEADIRLPERFSWSASSPPGCALTARRGEKGQAGLLGGKRGAPVPQAVTPTLSWVSLDGGAPWMALSSRWGFIAKEDARVINDWCPGAGLAGLGDPVEWVADEPALLGALEGWFSLYDPGSRHRLEHGEFLTFVCCCAAPNSWRRLRLGRGRELLLLALVPKRPQSGNVIIPGAWCWTASIPSRAPPGSSRAAQPGCGGERAARAAGT